MPAKTSIRVGSKLLFESLSINSYVPHVASLAKAEAQACKDPEELPVDQDEPRGSF